MTLGRTIPALVLLAGLTMAGGPAAAEKIVASLSTHRVLITSNFTGAELVLFGSIERDAATVSRRGGYDIVVTVRGPRQTIVTFRKQRLLGIWVNRESRTFVDVPSYLAVLSNRPIAEIANEEALRRLQVGLAQTLLPQLISGDVADVSPTDPFRVAFVRLNLEHGLYREVTNAVTFLTPTLFRTSIPLPANVPVGSYEVDIKLFADGAMLATQTSAIEIIKVGFEQFVANAAREHGFVYGLATSMMAILTGWLASIVFRRD
jgi:uncharacterized protein (TIGR02186 family)